MTKELLSQDSRLEHVPIFLLIDEKLKIDFKDYFQQRIPELYADIESLIINGPTCSCASKIKTYVLENSLQISELVLDFFATRNLDLNQYLSEIHLQEEPESLSGKVLKTTTENWATFAEEISNYTFNSFSVIEKDSELFVYFL